MATGSSRAAPLTVFRDWVRAHLKGDEKGEAQIFLDRMFQGFGWKGLREAGATCEERVKNDDGGTSFADLVWKPVVLVEMKARGVDLAKHYRQAFDYWVRLVPDRPAYVVLCNFDEFWVYDFNSQLDTPVDKVKLDELPQRFGPLNFLFPGDVKPVFGNHQEAVTRRAADSLASCFNSLVGRGIPKGEAQRFVLQLLVALFAQNIGLLEPYFVSLLIKDTKTPKDSFDLLGGLFEAMNAKGGTGGGRFKDVPYFNGGLFHVPARIELTVDEIAMVDAAAAFDWSKVRPEIFGTLFEHSLGAEERHAFGAHYTSPVDIMKIVGPTIVEPWSSRIEGAKSLKSLRALLARIESFTVLDPACGSGNFLYTAYRELKRLEARIYERIGEYVSVDPRQRPFGFLSTKNFFGIDVNSFAIDIAKVTMMLAHKLSIDELHINEPALPLDNLDKNFMVSDALVRPDGSRTPWFRADVIIGNPPFLGAKKIRPEHGDEYFHNLRAAYPEVEGMADLCVHWFARANQELVDCNETDFFAGRAGLVGTQNIRSNASRRGALDPIVATGTIVDAVKNQPWSGEANVHVSIVNWVKSKDAALLPRARRLWFKVKPKTLAKKRPKGSTPAAKLYELDVRAAPSISASLSDAVDVSKAAKLEANDGFCSAGQYPRFNDGFVIDRAAAMKMRAASSANEAVVCPFLVGDEVLSGESELRYVIDFQKRSIVEAQRFAEPFAHVRDEVLPYVEALAKAERNRTGRSVGQDQGWLKVWWQHFRPRAELIEKISAMKRYLVCSRITKRPIFAFVSTTLRPSDALTCFALDDDYSFGVLQSRLHYQWFHEKCSNMKDDPRYTSESVFMTFPWPQNPSTAAVDAVVAAARELQRIRMDPASRGPGGLRALYATLDLPGANPLRDASEALDRAVLAAYGFGTGDVLSQLLALNAECAARESRGETVQGPGIPSTYASAAALVSAAMEPL